MIYKYIYQWRLAEKPITILQNERSIPSDAMMMMMMMMMMTSSDCLELIRRQCRKMCVSSFARKAFRNAQINKTLRNYSCRINPTRKCPIAQPCATNMQQEGIAVQCKRGDLRTHTQRNGLHINKREPSNRKSGRAGERAAGGRRAGRRAGRRTRRKRRRTQRHGQRKLMRLPENAPNNTTERRITS